MQSVWISGLPGAGKTTLMEHMSRDGHAAFDTDQFSSWIDTSTNRPVSYEYHLARPDRPVAWRVDVERLAAVKMQTSGDYFFAAGCVSNEEDAWALFNVHLLLSVDWSVQRHRILTRTNNGYGKLPHQLRDLEEKHRTIENFYRARGFAIVDGGRPIEEVASEVLDTSSALSPMRL